MRRGGFGHELLIRFALKYSRPRLGAQTSGAPAAFESFCFDAKIKESDMICPTLLSGAPGRIRTSVARRALDLQSSAIDHSATDALRTLEYNKEARKAKGILAFFPACATICRHMSQEALVKLKSSKSDHIYWTRRGKKSKGVQNKEKLELKKFDPTIREHVVYKQVKK